MVEFRVSGEPSPELVEKLTGMQILEYLQQTVVQGMYYYFMRYMSDDNLESYRTNLIRDKIERQMLIKSERNKGNSVKELKESLKRINEDLKGAEQEKERRDYLAKHGAPKDKGEDKSSRQVVEEIKEYYVDNAFEELFESVTGFETFTSPNPFRMKYRCRMHGDDRNPSGMLYLDEGRWYCFGCGQGGDVLKLVMSFPPFPNFKEAVDMLWNEMPHYEEVKEGKWRRINP